MPLRTKQQRVDALMARPIDWPAPRLAVRMIATEEDCRLTAYLCSARVPTCGWGETDGVQLGMVWSQEYSDERFRQSLFEWSAAVQRMLKRPANENEFSALLSLSYNIGLPGLRTSTVLRQHNAGNSQAAARAFSLWNKETVERVVDGKVARVKRENKGLTARRAREAAVYLTPMEDEAPARMPQAVEGETPVRKSPIASGGGVAAATGAVGVLKGVSDIVADSAPDAAGTLGTVQETVGTVSAAINGISAGVESVLGVPMVLLVGLALAYAGYVVIKWRKRQRDEGWA